jgi:hypothetical protein
MTSWKLSAMLGCRTRTRASPPNAIPICVIAGGSDAGSESRSGDAEKGSGR